MHHIVVVTFKRILSKEDGPYALTLLQYYIIFINSVRCFCHRDLSTRVSDESTILSKAGILSKARIPNGKLGGEKPAGL